MIDFTSSAATTWPPTPPTSALVALMRRRTRAGFLANTYDLYEKMFGVLVTVIFSATVTGSPSSSWRDSRDSLRGVAGRPAAGAVGRGGLLAPRGGGGGGGLGCARRVDGRRRARRT